jgi:hypothetical protein
MEDVAHRLTFGGAEGAGGPQQAAEKLADMVQQGGFADPRPRFGGVAGEVRPMKKIW